MFKKVALLLGFVGAMVWSAQSQTLLFWVSQENFAPDAQPDLVDLGNNPVTVASNWLVQMYSTGDGIMDPAIPGIVGTDTPVAGGTVNVAIGTDGQFGTGGAMATLGGGGGIDVYSVLFNSSSMPGTPGGATHFAIIDDAPTSLPADSPQTPSFTYNVGNMAVGDWQAVPEPGTIIVMALGGLLIWIRRLRK